jgi:hypothetical protein
MSSSQKGSNKTQLGSTSIPNAQTNFPISHTFLPVALAALGDVLVARYRHWLRCRCRACTLRSNLFRSKDAAAAHVPYRNSKLTHILQVMVVVVVVAVVVVVVVVVVVFFMTLLKSW